MACMTAIDPQLFQDAAELQATMGPRAAAGGDAVALFPCFMRGKNAYGRNPVEPDAVTALLPRTPIYGLFCHGERGPQTGLGFNSTPKPQHACTQHRMTTVVAVHARSD
jgi:small ligand-binding sensory domain FIST